MPRTKSNPKPILAPAMTNGRAAEVMTLQEAAAFLRLDKDEVLHLVREQDLPGRLAGNEWRFLESAICNWLASSPPKPSKEAQLAVAGAWQGDPLVEEELREIYQRRGRPMTED